MKNPPACGAAFTLKVAPTWDSLSNSRSGPSATRTHASVGSTEVGVAASSLRKSRKTTATCPWRLTVTSGLKAAGSPAGVARFRLSPGPGRAEPVGRGGDHDLVVLPTVEAGVLPDQVEPAARR